MLLKNIANIFKTAQIITHTDLDGYGAGAVLVKTLTILGFDIDDIEVTNTNYSNPLPINDNHKLLLISDISISNSIDANKLIEYSSTDGNLVLWFDHHKSSIEMEEVCPKLKDIKGIRNTNGCGTMLCWIFYQIINHYLSIDNQCLSDVFNELENINVYEIVNSDTPGIWEDKYLKSPEGIILTDDYDRFVLSDERSKYLMEAFNSDPTFKKDCKSDYFQTSYINDIYINNNYIDNGKKLYLWKRIISLINLKNSGFIASFPKSEISDIRMICMNSVNRGSLLFGRCLGNDILSHFNYACVYYHNGSSYTVSVYYTEPDSETKIYDASDICKMYGGGGHPGAAGFVTKNLEFSNISPLSESLKNQIDEEIEDLLEEVYENSLVGEKI